MSAVRVFAYDDTEIRTVLPADGDPWFVAADIARPLGYRWQSDMTRRLDEDDRGTRSVRTPIRPAGHDRDLRGRPLRC
ncbi:BRO family protein, partial [Micromonospora sp. WMMA1363]|uniref:BRO-N domain-containing protein n=1 Tax=Micromonospora sp. WMMA1363 TaxID=3053985 RepID=UPI00259D06A7